jgi:hypothetical protein
MLAAAALAAATTALAKLPPVDDAGKAKAAEAAAKAAWQGKQDAYLLCKAQDRIAARYKSGHPAQAKVAAAEAASGAAMAAKMPASTPATASTQGSATPVAAVANPAPAIPSCADPGPFAYAPPDQKPLETSGAHSPAANATSPPSVRAESGTMTSGKASGAPAPGGAPAAARK